MFDYDQSLRAYHDVKVKLPQAIRDKLCEHRSVNRQRLINGMPDSIAVSESSFVPQGSYSVWTTIQETGNAYDIDDGLVLPRDQLQWSENLDYPPNHVKQLVRDAVKDDRFNAEPKILPNCVRVFYAEGHHVDIATYRTYESGGGTIKEIASDFEWKASDPRRITVWFEDTVKTLNAAEAGAGTQMRRMVRLLKRFAKSRGDSWDMPGGLKLTMLAVESYSPLERDDEAFRSMLQKMSTRLAEDLVVVNFADTEEPKAELTRTESDTNMVLLRDKTEEALKQLEVLDAGDCSPEDATAAWDWLFQSEGFLQAYEKDSAKAVEVFEKVVLINAGVASTDAGLHIGQNGMRNREHRFYGEE